MELAENQHVNQPVKAKTGWINAVLIPIKQHLGCCILPKVVGALTGSSSALSKTLETPTAECGLFLTVPPLVTWGVMAVEQKMQNRHQTACNMCEEGKILTRKNYLKQAALAYVFYAASHFITHDLLHWGHHHDEDIPPTTQIVRRPSWEKRV